MKKILIICATLSLFACNSNSKTDMQTSPADTGAYKNNSSGDTPHVTAAPLPENVKTSTKKITTVDNSLPRKSKVRDTIVRTTTSSGVTHIDTTINTKTGPVTAPAPVATATPVAPAATPTAPAAPQKKGWSSAAKSATIGGVGGAIGGAIISKKKGTGALIGGALGAAGGYLYGRNRDKKAAAKDTTGN